MHFKLECTIRGLFLKKNGPVRFAYPGARETTVSLQCPTENERRSGHDITDTFCTAASKREPSGKVRPMFESLARNELPAGSEAFGKGPHPEYIDEDGHIRQGWVVPLEVLPEPFRSFAEDVRRELLDYTRRTAHVLRWRGGRPGPHNPVSTRTFDWSFDGQLWRPMPTSIEAYVEVLSSWDVPDKVHHDVMQWVQESATEPLGHELYREAWEERHGNPRSSLIVGIAAAEVGFKQCVGTLVPDARWLVDNIPSPPLVRMLRDYLPLLPAKCTIRGRVLPPPTAIIDLLEKGVNLRNRAAHAGAATFDYETLEEVLLAVRDLLWILDYYRGFHWALDHVSQEVRKALESAAA